MMDDELGGGMIQKAKTDAYFKTTYKGKVFKSKTLIMDTSLKPIDFN